MNRLVLDTNVYRGVDLSVLSSLKKRGCRVSISQVAFVESWARSVKEYRRGRSRQEARGLFFGRARKVAQYLDSDEPIAIAGGLLHKRVEASVVGGIHVPSEERSAALRAQWQQVAGVGLVDEEWLVFGEQANASLDALDVSMRKLNPGLRKCLRGLIGQSQSHGEMLESVIQFVAKQWGLTPAVARRFDAALRFLAYRLVRGAVGAETFKENDGADLRLPFHIGDGRVLVTNERALRRIVANCGTFQAAWIRSTDELEVLPSGSPWT